MSGLQKDPIGSNEIEEFNTQFMFEHAKTESLLAEAAADVAFEFGELLERIGNAKRALTFYKGRFRQIGFLSGIQFSCGYAIGIGKLKLSSEGENWFIVKNTLTNDLVKFETELNSEVVENV